MGFLDIFKSENEEGVDLSLLREELEEKESAELVDLIISGKEEVETLEETVGDLEEKLAGAEEVNVELSKQLAEASSGKETKFKGKADLERESALLKKRLTRAQSTGRPRGMS